MAEPVAVAAADCRLAEAEAEEDYQDRSSRLDPLSVASRRSGYYLSRRSRSEPAAVADTNRHRPDQIH